jgi:pimeloyl-ACP methyl ester carboxylesterase
MTTTAVVHKTIDLRHGKTRYIDVGSGEPMLVLHISSIEGGADDCLATLDVLASKFRVIAPDLIGWPPSDTYDGIDAFPGIIDHLRELQDALGIEKWHVVGASMGGWIAGLFAYESPDRVIKAVIGGHPFTGAANRRMIDYTIDMITSDDKVREWVENVTKGQGVDTEALVKEKLAKINEPGFKEAFVKVMRTMGNPTNRDRYSMIHRLPHMRVPYLVLIAERDEAAMNLKDQVTAATNKNGQVKTIASGHRMHLEDPELFANTVKDYLQS